jgi:tryptophan halogenase
MWQERQAMAIPDTLAEKIAHFRASGRIVLSSDELFRDASWFAVLDGQGERPGDHNPLIEAVGRDDNLRQLAALRADIAKVTATLPPIPA